MKTDTANIVAFPDTHRATEANPCRRQPFHQLASQIDKPPTLETKASARSHPKPLVARPGPRQVTADEHANHVASVVRIAIRSAKRRGVRLESLLSIPRKWLLELCDEGDPTSLLVRDWLTGSHKFHPSELEDLATTSALDEQVDA